jgi:hypothetical protein
MFFFLIFRDSDVLDPRTIRRIASVRVLGDRRLLYALFIRIYGAYAYFFGNDGLKFSKKLKFHETADSSGPCFSFSVLVAVLVNTATERDCPEQHSADTAGVRTDEHVKEQED